MILAGYPEVIRFVCENCQDIDCKGPRAFQPSFHSAKAEYSIKECSKNTHLGVDMLIPRTNAWVGPVERYHESTDQSFKM